MLLEYMLSDICPGSVLSLGACALNIHFSPRAAILLIYSYIIRFELG